MDVRQIRRGNMLALINGEKTKAAFARKVGTDPAYISQILSTKTRAEVGNDLARAIEGAYGLPYGWMDHEHQEAKQEEIEQGVVAEFSSVYLSSTEEGRAFLRGAVAAVKSAFVKAEQKKRA